MNDPTQPQDLGRTDAACFPNGPYHRAPIALMLTGPAGVGKSTFAEAVHKELVTRGVRCGRFAFASLLKDAVGHAEQFAGLQRTKWSDYEAKAAARPLLVALGAHFRAKSPTVFVDFLLRSVRLSARAAGTEVAIVEDLRYPNEFTGFKAGLPLVVSALIERAGYGPANPEEERSLSELSPLFAANEPHTTVAEWRGEEELDRRAAAMADYLTDLVEAQRKSGKVMYG